MPATAPVQPSPILPVRSVGVIGCGLMGGSIALAARDAGLRVAVFDADADLTADLAAAGLVVCNTPGGVCEGSDVVFLATHVDAILSVATMVKPFLEPDTIVTDIASVKGPVRALAGLLGGERITVIPTHPMAGSAQSGFSNAGREVIDGCTWLICTEGGDVQTARLSHLLVELGARRVLSCPAEQHDTMVAIVSHLPQMASTLLAATAYGAAQEYGDAALSVAGSGFRDTTRLADSSPAMWRPILAANAAPVSLLLREFGRQVLDAAALLERGDLDGVDELFHKGREARAEWRAAQDALPPLGADVTEAADPETWGHPTSHHQAWLDRSLGWPTTRTSATSAPEHRALVAAFLASIAGGDVESAIRAAATAAHDDRRASENYLWVAAVLNDAGIAAEHRSMWTADGIPVGGVELPGVGFIVVT